MCKNPPLTPGVGHTMAAITVATMETRNLSMLSLASMKIYFARRQSGSKNGSHPELVFHATGIIDRGGLGAEGHLTLAPNA
jgi:hypothetical protein